MPAKALKTIDVSDMYVSPGFIDIHSHHCGTAGTWLHPDGTHIASRRHNGCRRRRSGWRNFAEFKEQVIDTAGVRLLAWINIVGRGMDGRKTDQDQAGMNPEATAKAIRENRSIIVGIKTAHYGPEWVAVERSVEAAKLADAPVIVDFGTFRSFEGAPVRRTRDEKAASPLLARHHLYRFAHGQHACRA
jgi:dihydroorotase